MPSGIFPRKKGVKRAEETKLKMSLASKGIPKSDAHKKALSIAKTGKPHILSVQGKLSFKNKMSGINNPKWIEDRSLLKKQEERNGNRHKEWSRSVKNRDNWKCKISNCDCSGQVVAHHILPWRDYVELRYEVNNGITLCHFHHPRKRNDEMRLSPYFQELVNSN